MTTSLAPAWRCFEEVALSRKIPVDSPLHDVDACMSRPWQRGGILRGADADLAAVDEDGFALAPDLGASRVRVHRIVLEEMRQSPRIGETIDAHHPMSPDSSAARKNTRPIRPNPPYADPLPWPLPSLC